MLTLAEGLLAAPAQAGTPPVISVATAQDVNPLGLAWRGPPGLPSVSLSESEVPHLAPCVSFSAWSRLLAYQSSASSAFSAAQRASGALLRPGAWVTRGKGLGVAGVDE